MMAGEKKSIRNVDIAREAGVANSVVSSYFSGNYYDKRKGAVVGIGKETKERIRKACRKLGYRPTDSSLFMEMYPDEADVIFLLNRESGSFSNLFFSLILDGLADEAQLNRINLCLGWFEGGVDYCVQTDKVPRVVKNNPTGKYVLAGQPNYSLILHLLQSGAKVVYISRYIKISGVMSIAPDYFNAARMAIGYLKKHGHERIGVVAESHFHQNDYHTGQLVQGCAEEMGGFTYEDIIHCPHSEEESKAVKDIFLGDNPPTAIFCFDDPAFIGLMRTLSPLGIRVPEDLSAVSCNDEQSCLSPHITGIGLPMYDVGRSAFRKVTEFATGGAPVNAELEVWPVTLIERESVLDICCNPPVGQSGSIE